MEEGSSKGESQDKGEVMVSFSHGHGEKDMTKGRVNESGENASYKSMETVKMKKR